VITDYYKFYFLSAELIGSWIVLRLNRLATESTGGRTGPTPLSPYASGWCV